MTSADLWIFSYQNTILGKSYFSLSGAGFLSTGCLAGSYFFFMGNLLFPLHDF